MAFLWSLVVIDPLFILSTFLCGCVSISLTLFDKTGDSSMRVGRVWARSLLWITGVRVTVEGLEKIDLNRNYLFCSNHLSYMDTPVVMSNIPAQFRFLAKKGLFQIPLLGTHLKPGRTYSGAARRSARRGQDHDHRGRRRSKSAGFRC